MVCGQGSMRKTKDAQVWTCREQSSIVRDMNQPISEHARHYGRRGAVALVAGAVKLYLAHFRLLVLIVLPLLAPAFLPLVLGAGFLHDRWIRLALSLLLMCLVRGALVQALSRCYYGQFTSWTDAYRRGLARLGAIFLMGLIKALAYAAPVLGGLLAVWIAVLPPRATMTVVASASVVAILLGLYLCLRWSVGLVATVVERHDAMDSLRRSWELTGRKLGHALATGVCALIVAAVFAVLLSLAADVVLMLLPAGFATPFWRDMGSELLGILILPFLSAVEVQLFFDLRHR